jgi:hypothetical protein
MTRVNDSEEPLWQTNGVSKDNKNDPDPSGCVDCSVAQIHL